MSAGERLKESRAKAGFETATAAAKARGWNENTYRSHENGVRGVKTNDAIRYAEAFSVDAGWLLTGSQRAMDPPVSEGKDHRVPVMMTAAEVIAIDNWGFANRVRSRSEAIRRLCSTALSLADRDETP